mmetsp:Transcript_3476/g.8834  ORF Transcript_3476/g.8834 Transcript_3476/m.8834 type:complete len:583 (-) Transcript_3476:337-2085(-)|eukprot:CAMPEP_0181125598 /NCGR_PEP_ID=MMETSP1071-20121207/27141_1 /TAXON_ID=35127 /ORGANISM="Thalassiosira sp., Strain NH16" /LENGTH=582 /DNA_ID=CAMNT_0023211063 /DNA_START=71 /DNA_END=1819 /DNA_ORIENTATION=+
MVNQSDRLISLPAPGEKSNAEASRPKRRRVNYSPTGSSKPTALLVECSKGRMPHGFVPKEFILHLPPRLTKSAYQTLLACEVAPRQWHLDGRFGSRTHNVDNSVNGIPVLYDQKDIAEISLKYPELRQLLDTEGVTIVEKDFVENHRTRQAVPEADARIHPELEPSDFVLPHITPKQIDAGRSCENRSNDFTYAEMFGGIGGFGVGLERLGGECVFYSEIDDRCRETYALNFDTPSSCIHGDIYEVPDAAFPQNLDLLVGGFPCQPFSTLGEQPGFDCDKGRGQLFLQIVRALELSKPKAFICENVPGLLGMKDTLKVIVNAFRGAGYSVTAEVCSARGLTAASRKRLFFVGIKQKDLEASDARENPRSASLFPEEQPLSLVEDTIFQFPFIPDLKLCCHDILDYDSLPLSELEMLRLSQSSWNQLAKNRRWKPSHLAWPNRHCDTLTSHYGNAVGRGESQLVPSSAPHPPRRFSVRECARIMGFPNTFNFCDIRSEQGEMAHRKEGYRMLGNAVCPPLIAALAGSVLDAAGIEMKGIYDKNWTSKGRCVAIDMACASLRSNLVALPAGCLISSYVGKGSKE